ncbi:conserved hypothetical protein [Ricinus communis]|uniref:Uncharacterized protein n=1 Tax=Ricinus communis TaxID=3988 RepID=B9SI22_RICCO|nr:conserved hypothetical protein [Ricinus communis]
MRWLISELERHQHSTTTAIDDYYTLISTTDEKAAPEILLHYELKLLWFR